MCVSVYRQHCITNKLATVMNEATGLTNPLESLEQAANHTSILCRNTAEFFRFWSDLSWIISVYRSLLPRLRCTVSFFGATNQYKPIPKNNRKRCIHSKTEYLHIHWRLIGTLLDSVPTLLVYSVFPHGFSHLHVQQYLRFQKGSPESQKIIFTDRTTVLTMDRTLNYMPKIGGFSLTSLLWLS